MRQSGVNWEKPLATAIQHRRETVELAARLSFLPGGLARDHVKRALGRLGCSYETARFSVALRIPRAWQVQIQGTAPGSRWTTVPSAAALGSPTCRGVEGPVIYVGTGAPAEYQGGGEGYQGSIVLAALGSVPSRQVIHTARDSGALGVLVYHPRASSVQAVAPETHLPLPAATIGLGAATALAHIGGTARLEIDSEEQDRSFENIFVRRGGGPLHIVVVAHYDSRPRRLGPGGRSLNLAVMLSLLATLDPPADRRITFALMDGEEFGSVASAQYYEDIRNQAVEPPDLVVDLNALGTRRELGLEVQHPGGHSRHLQQFALQTLEAAGLRVFPRELDPRFYGGTARLRMRWPVLALGGRPLSRIPCGDSEQGIPDRWGVSRLVSPIARILCEARP